MKRTICSSCVMMPYTGCTYRLKRNPTRVTTVQQWNRIHRAVTLSPKLPATLESRSLLLLGRSSRQLRKSCTGANTVYSQADRTLSLYITSQQCVTYLAIRNIARKCWTSAAKFSQTRSTRLPCRTDVTEACKLTSYTTILIFKTVAFLWSAY
jgi:RNase P subunit RPR2